MEGNNWRLNFLQFLIHKKPLDQSKLLNTKEEILKPLRIVRESLEENQNENIANGDLLDLMRRAKCFGINLARLDIRQESSRHTQLMNEIIKKKFNKNYNQLSEDKKEVVPNLCYREEEES